MKLNNLSIQNLSKSFCKQNKEAPLDVLKDISFAFEQNKSYAIMGASGSGKSTLLHILAGLEKPTSGQVFFGNKNIEEFNQAEKETYLNKSIGLLFQDPFLIRELTVWQNVALKSFNFNMQTKAQAKKLLESIDLKDKADDHPNMLSGGQMQRVAILRALFNKPQFLLADEPTGNLDAASGKILLNLLIKCKKEYNLGLILSTHDASIADKMDIILNLEDRKLVAV